MLVGIDVGGTHTDAVLLDDRGVVDSFKVVTDHHNLLTSIHEALAAVTKNTDKGAVTRINLSTTLSTNAIVEDRLEDVGVIVSSGPGIDPENFRIGNCYVVIPGSIDHRGTVIKDLDQQELKQAVKRCSTRGVRVFAAVTKFSTRNPDQENEVARHVEELSDFITPGHTISGNLSFPRRVATAYYNSAVWRIYNRFADAIQESIRNLGIEAQLNILKADGGTMPFDLARKLPVESILSGPAASIMGIISLCDITEDSIILDIGGTTTDIAVFASGAPLLERDGVALNAHRTLVRALQNKSIGIGGDSALWVSGDSVKAGPHREGPAMANNGNVPTLVDALNVTGAAACGDTVKSAGGIAELAKKHGLSSDRLAAQAVACAVDTIKKEADALLRRIHERPVYTIHEMLEGTAIVPKKLYIMGGPAQAFSGLLSDTFGMETVTPENYAVANAIGAAVAKTTFDVELFADTCKGLIVVPNLNIRKRTPRSYSVREAREDAKQFLMDYLGALGIGVAESEIEILESSEFKMVQGYHSSGSDIRVKCQVKPGVVMNVHGLT